MSHPPSENDLFISAWESYRTMVACDYLWHSLVMDALRRRLDRMSAPVRFLDLACGDAERTTDLLQHRRIERYTGVDRSAAALEIAARNMQRLRAPSSLVQADFVDYLESCDQSFDLIFVGLSAHHLNDSQLPRFFRAVRNRLSPNGAYVSFEPFLLPDETRQDYVDRFTIICDRLWVGMTIDQRRGVNKHVAESDYPRTIDDWNRLTREAGLSDAEILMKTPDRICMTVSHVRAD